VLPYAGSISGLTSVCAGSSITLSESAPGGSWSSSNASVATVSGGAVAGVAAGAVTISYSVTNSCGTRSATYTVTVVSTDLCNTMVNNANGNSSEINVYPNPATATLSIDAPVKVNVRVLSIDGKVLIEQKDATIIDVTGIADGMYLVMIYDEAGQLLKTTKFAKIQ